MKVTAEMKVKDALKINKQMLEAFVWLAPEFERLRNPVLRRVMANRVTIEQAARVAKLPLTEALYVLNLAAGMETAELHSELNAMPVTAFHPTPDNPLSKPVEIVELKDDDARVRFADMMPDAQRQADPLPTIMRHLLSLRDASEVLLVRHPFDPIPLRDLLARRGYGSWAEERYPSDWYIYFYRPRDRAAARAHPPLPVALYARAIAAGA
jgi:Domain of unknown function (DUF1858)/Uncharacterized conserved protein (DUF2249)